MAKTLEEALENVFDVVAVTQEARGEESPGGKKITVTEIPNILINSAGLVSVFTNAKEIKEDALNMSDEYKAAIKSNIKQKYSHNDPKKEARVERLTDLLIEVVDTIGDWNG